MCRQECECRALEDRINAEFPEEDWTFRGESCLAWQDRSLDLENNDIEFEPHSDEGYACTCPTCGRVVCGWCV